MSAKYKRLGTYEVRCATTGGLLGSFTCTDVAGSQQTASQAALDRVAALKKQRVKAIVNFMPEPAK